MRARTRPWAARVLATTVTAVAVLWASGSAPASTVRRASISEMLAACELVFEGRVIEVYAEALPQGIHTWVRFEVADVIKGTPPATRFRLRFLGGQIGDRIEDVVGLRIPAVGEHGIYFVESLQRFQVNPLYGWDQGRLLIQPDAQGRDRVVSAEGAPVTALTAESAEAAEGVARLSTGVAQGLISDATSPLEDALSPARLKAGLAARLGRVR